MERHVVDTAKIKLTPIVGMAITHNQVGGCPHQHRKPQNLGDILAPMMNAAWRIHRRDRARGTAILQALYRTLCLWRNGELP